MKLVEDKKEISVENEEYINLKNETVYGEERSIKDKIFIITGNFIAYSIFLIPILHIISILLSGINVSVFQNVDIIPSFKLIIIYSIFSLLLATLTEVASDYNFKELYILGDDEIIKTERRLPTEQHEIEWNVKKRT